MSVLQYKCPNCDGPLIFSPDTQDFTCEYCMSRFSGEDLARITAEAESKAESREEKQAAAEFAGEMVSYTCPSCGAEVMTTSTTAATFCFYCHNPVVISGRLTGDMKPDVILPFKLSRDDAVSAFKKMTKGKKYLPSSFTEDSTIEKMTGVYFPYWYADADVKATVHATGSVKRSWKDGDYEVTETKKYQVVRGGNVQLRDLNSPAMKEADKLALKYVCPYDTKDMIPFSMQYLSGMQAEKRDITRQEAAPDINRRAREYSEQQVMATMNGYSDIVKNASDVATTDVRWKYALMPVWMMTYLHGDERLVYAINGQTGKVFGKLPVDKSKLNRTFLITAGIICAAITVIGGLIFA